MLGIVPAAGSGKRWGKYPKELLPIGPMRWLIDASIDAMRAAGCDRICVVTSPEKAGIHAAHFAKDKYRDANVFFVLQSEKHDIFGAIEATFPFTEEINLFAMSDTIIPKDAFVNLPLIDFLLGVHKTTMPERFGVITDGQVINKSKKLSGREMMAWGTLAWSKDVVDYWRNIGVHDYTEAINCAMAMFGYKEIPLDFYIDLAEWEDYQCWITSQP